MAQNGGKRKGVCATSPTVTSVVGVPVDVCFHIKFLILHLRDVKDFTRSIIDLSENVSVESVVVHDELVLVYGESFRSEFNPLTDSAAANNTFQLQIFHLVFNLCNTFGVSWAGSITLRKILEIISFHQVFNNGTQFISGKLMPTVHPFDDTGSDGFDAGGNARHWICLNCVNNTPKRHPVCRWWTPHELAHDRLRWIPAVVSYRKSDEAGGTAVDENTSPPILPSGKHKKTAP